MKVKELIAKLQEFDGELPVVIPIRIEVNDTIIIEKLNIIDIFEPSPFHLDKNSNTHSIILIAK